MDTQIRQKGKGTSPQPLIKIDLRGILRKRMPRKVSRFVPDFAIGMLERLIHQSELNEMLEKAWPREGSEFSDALLEHLGITLEVEGLDRLPEGSYIFASNHPLGGLDGIALIKVLGEKYGDDHVRFLVNDMLMNVAPLRTVFLPINKYGAQGRSAAAEINATYADPTMQVLIFPAGIVSRLHPDGAIRDLEWKTTFVKRALASGRSIVPVRFEALNTPRFYRLARLRKKLRIKVNLEQSLLPGELCKARGRHFRIFFGEPVTPDQLRENGNTPQEMTAFIRSLSENLGKNGGTTITR